MVINQKAILFFSTNRHKLNIVTAAAVLLLLLLLLLVVVMCRQYFCRA